MSDHINIAKHVGKQSWLGRTLPSLLYRTNAVYPNSRAFVQFEDQKWKPYSTSEFTEAAEELAVGLLELGLQPGDRVALYQESDVYFCLADMGCLIAGLVNVPIYLTHTAETIKYVLGHASAHAVISSGGERVRELASALDEKSSVHTIILTQPVQESDRAGLPESIKILSLSDVRSLGRRKMDQDPDSVRSLSDRLDPSDLATIIYTSGTTGLPKGVMLTHENISSNALMSYAGMVGYIPGEGGEVMLSFLPLTHVFARTLYYGALAYGTSQYFSNPDRLIQDLSTVRPTILPTVPRVLEKVYARILSRSQSMGGVGGRIARWGLSRAQSDGKRTSGVFHLIANKLVYKKWRSVLGGNIRFIISGGAALNARIATVFDRAGITILQGYGLTETSPVISFNRPDANRHGTVGQPLEAVEVKIAEDGEILTRGPHIMAGYFRDPEKTASVMDDDGWFSTGDIGELSDDGFLRITDRKKDIFKLSTGKYVMPQPLENRLCAEPLIDQAVVIGSGHKYAAALIFPNEENIRSLAISMGKSKASPLADLVVDEAVVRHIDRIVERANEGFPHWSTIKRFVIIAGELTVENELLTPTLKVKRSRVRKHFEQAIDQLYHDENIIDESQSPLDEG